MFYNNAKVVVDELLKSLNSRYCGKLERSIREINFIFDSIEIVVF